MNIPGRLRASTLGDLLGQLHRGQVSGALELREASGPTAGRVHRIYLRAGLVLFVEQLPGTGQPPGGASPMGREEVKTRLEAIFALEDAQLAFHVIRATPSLAPPAPLAPAEFLHGRPRARDRHGRFAPSTPPPPAAGPKRSALATLGLPPDATAADVQRAFKTLAQRIHPDRFARAPAEQRAELSARLSRLTQAYHVLIA